MSSNTEKKPSLVIAGTDKYYNPHSYTGEREKNYVEVEVEANEDQS